MYSILALNLNDDFIINRQLIHLQNMYATT